MAFLAFAAAALVCVETLVFGKSNKVYLVIGGIGGLLMRPHYFVSYAFIVVWVYFFRNVRIAGRSHQIFSFSANLFFVFMGSAGLALILWCFSSAWNSPLLDLMHVSESYFLSYDAASNRHWIEWEDSGDFFMNMGWGIFFSIIGPLPTEVLRRPEFFPFFLEGLVSLFFIFYFLVIMVKRYARYSSIRGFLLYAFIPAVTIALIIHYPFGIFNPGSAGRYKQSLAPLFYFLPMLLIAALKKKQLETAKQ